MSGPQFLAVYQLVLVMAVAYAAVSRWLVHRNGSADRVGRAPLGVPELAYLAGGPRRVVETAIAALVDSGALRPARRGTVRAVHPAGTVADPVQAAVLRAAEQGATTVPRLVDAVRTRSVLEPVRAKLVADGLLVEPSVARARLRLAVAPLVMLFAVGLTRCVNGVLLHRPVGWLVLHLVVTAVLVALFRWHRDRLRTLRGQRALHDARRGQEADDAPATVGGMPLAVGLVALGGLAAFPDDDLRAALRPRPSSSFGGGDGGAGFASCGSGSSSCGGGGGGGCGGGGCGG
jgi:uncharacterized protein (TIGR04222 family)